MSKRDKKSPSQFLIYALGAYCACRKDPRGLRWTALLVIAVTGLAISASAQIYAGAMSGISTLSGDARSLISPSGSSFASYNPANGPILEALLGDHLSDYFSVQLNYAWNRNSLTLSSAVFANGAQSGFEETRNSSQQSVVGDLLVYFRDRESRLRPFLAVGTGVVHFSSSQQSVAQIIGGAILPPSNFSANEIALHVPVGIDVKLGKAWAFRYSFSETISKNPISNRLSPPGQHSFKNFDNLFGFVKTF